MTQKELTLVKSLTRKKETAEQDTDPKKSILSEGRSKDTRPLGSSLTIYGAQIYPAVRRELYNYWLWVGVVRRASCNRREKVSRGSRGGSGAPEKGSRGEASVWKEYQVGEDIGQQKEQICLLIMWYRLSSSFSSQMLVNNVVSVFPPFFSLFFVSYRQERQGRWMKRGDATR